MRALSLASVASVASAVLVALAIVGCPREEPRPVSPRAVNGVTSASSAATSPPPKSCLLDGSAAVVRVLQGETTHTPMGLDVTFVGTMHDDYEDGRFDDLAELRFTRGGATETRLLSVYAPSGVTEIFDLCWEMQSASGREVRLVFYPRVSP